VWEVSLVARTRGLQVRGERMVEPSSGRSESLDVKRIHYLVRLMKRYDLTALDVNDQTLQIRLRRRGAPESRLAHAEPQLSPTQPQAAVATRAEPVRDNAPTAVKSVCIESPMVGTYYASHAPDAPPFVSPGSIVQPNTIVCIIEAMKVFTDIPAGISGTIAEVLVKNGQAVEYGQPLFRVIPA
jgi:acetyl-CoA carboxylase biotin carboxyl carrier protein